MEKKGVEKFFKKLIMSKFPMCLDVYVDPFIEGSRRYEIYIIFNVEDFKEGMRSEIVKYVKTISRYANVDVMGLYIDTVDDKK